jgi:hypothetical protein
MEALAESLAQHPGAWLAILALGAYHGLNPGMGWLLAVSNGLQSRRASGVLLALPPIALGHFLAIGAALLPFAVLGLYLERLREVRMAAGLLLVGFGCYKLLARTHPRFLARVRPAHIALWSFLMATAHGAGLMLVPVVLDLCGTVPGGHLGHDALREVAGRDLGVSINAATLHTIAMVASGGAAAWLVYRFAGLRFLGRMWLNLDVVWALMLIAVGAAAFVLAFVATGGSVAA